MSARTDGGRANQRGRAHLVLVRGGLAPRSEQTGDPDWRAFCERIGWNAAEPALPEDYEDRLLERVFGGSAADEPVRASFVGLAKRARPRRSGTASVAFVVAALVGVAAAALLPLMLESKRPVTASPDPAAAGKNEGVEAPAQPDPEQRSTEAREEQSPPVIVTPKPNGSRVVRVARSRAPAQPGGRASSKSAAPPAPEAHAPAALDPHEKDGYSEMAATAALAPPVLRWTDPAAERTWRTPVVVSAPARPALASWSLSPAGERWFGASLPPTTEPIDAANAGAIGVMAKVDFAKLATF